MFEGRIRPSCGPHVARVFETAFLNMEVFFEANEFEGPLARQTNLAEQQLQPALSVRHF